MRLPTISEEMEEAFHNLSFEDFLILIGNLVVPTKVPMEELLESCMDGPPSSINGDELRMLLQWSSCLHMILCKFAKKVQDEKEQPNN